LQKVGDATLQVDGMSLMKKIFPFEKPARYLPQDSFFIDGTIRENLIWDAEHIPDENEIFEILLQVNALHLVRENN
jgi:ATP-binding cassette subfamily C protein